MTPKGGWRGKGIVKDRKRERPAGDALTVEAERVARELRRLKREFLERDERRRRERNETTT